MTDREKEQLFTLMLKVMGSPVLSEDGESLAMSRSIWQPRWSKDPANKRELFLEVTRKGLELEFVLRVFTRDEMGDLKQEDGR